MEEPDSNWTATGINFGVRLEDGGAIQASESASIRLTGTGGTGGNWNYGVNLRDSGTIVSSVDGDITLDGTGGSDTNGGIWQNGVMLKQTQAS